MHLFRLVWKEFLFSPLTSGMCLLAVAAAVACSVATVTSLRAHQKHVQARVQVMDDEIRKSMKQLGFNVNILPREQNLVDFYAQDFAEKTMPYDFVARLADSKNIVTINHLRPALIRKVEWPEARRQVVLMGVQGVVPWNHRQNPKKPLAEAVPAGHIVLGYQLGKELNLKQGDTAEVFGTTYTVHKVFPARGDKDDITVFLDLQAAQDILQLPNQINLIQALECNCASLDRLAEIEAEISNVLGDQVQVVEFATIAIPRAKARTLAKEEGEKTVRDLEHRALVYTLLAVVAAGLLVGLLFLANVHQRRGEIGIFRALGLSTGRILSLFLSKALVLGFLGATIGYAAGLFLGWKGQPRPTEVQTLMPVTELFIPGLLLIVFLFTPLLTVVASWLPALVAANQQPATVLARE